MIARRLPRAKAGQECQLTGRKTRGLLHCWALLAARRGQAAARAGPFSRRSACLSRAFTRRSRELEALRGCRWDSVQSPHWTCRAELRILRRVSHPSEVSGSRGLPDSASSGSPASARFSLAGRRALISGATRGIGRAIAAEFLELGADVFVIARDEQRLSSSLEGWRTAHPQRRVAGFAGDVSVDAERRAAFRALELELGGLDLLVNNVGT